jgi:tripartite-type tricarboxylate transporter receptor subunit TctC
MWFPPALQRQRVQLLRKAFVNTLQDPGFLADAKKSNLDLEPISGEELEKTVAKLFKVSPAIKEELSKALLAK